MHNTVCKTVLFSILSVGSLYAQSIIGMQFPLGLPNTTATGPSLSMAGVGTAIQDDFFGMAENPANLGSMNRAAFSAVSTFDITSITSSGARGFQTTFSPRLISFSIPLKWAGSFGVSVDQRTTQGTTYRSIAQIQADPLTSITSIDYRLESKGGLTVWQGGWGYSVGKLGTIGLSYERLFYTQATLKSRVASSDIEQSLTDTTQTNFRANGFRGGVQIPLGALTLGASGEYILRTMAKQSNSGTSQKFSLRLPPSFNVGASYRFSPEWLAAAELDMTLWERYSSKIDIGLPVDNSYTIAAGTQFIPAPEQLTARYWETMQYKGGVRYSTLPISTASEASITLGVGLPIQQGSGLFDIFFEYGRRWDTNFAQYNEDFYKIQLGFNGGSQWFQSSERVTSY